MKRWMVAVAWLGLGLVAIPAMGQEDQLPDQIEPTVVDFGSTTGVSDPAILHVWTSTFDGDQFNDVVVFSEADGVAVGALTDSGFEDVGADLPPGTPTAVNGAQDETLESVLLIAITTPGPQAHLFSVAPDGTTEELISKAGYRTTGGGESSPEGVSFPLVSADGTADVSWFYWSGGGEVEEFDDSEAPTDVHDVAVEWDGDDYAGVFALYGEGDTRTLDVINGGDSVEVPGAPEELITTTYDFGPIVATVGSSGGEADLYMYRYELPDAVSLVIDPDFASAPQSNLGEITGDAALVTLGDGRLLSAFTGGGADLVPIIDLFDPDGEYLDSYVFENILLVGDMGIIHGSQVTLVGSDPIAETYRALLFAPFGRFLDDDDSVHEIDIEAIAERGITFGCDPTSPGLFCPENGVSRGQMAAFLARAFDLTAAGENPFDDTEDSVFIDDITAIAEAGITLGCNPPDNTHFCPLEVVTRGEMAGFLARGFDLTPTGDNPFEDTEDSVFVNNITAIAEAGITLGCNPPDNTLYCPSDDVTRAEIASFLIRGLEG